MNYETIAIVILFSYLISLIPNFPVVQIGMMTVLPVYGIQ